MTFANLMTIVVTPASSNCSGGYALLFHTEIGDEDSSLVYKVSRVVAIKVSMMKRISWVLLAIPILTACGPSAKEKEAATHRREAIKSAEAAFYKAGPIVVSETKTKDGTIMAVDIPVPDDYVAMVKRCVLFVGNNGGQAIDCEEPEIKIFGAN